MKTIHEVSTMCGSRYVLMGPLRALLLFLMVMVVLLGGALEVEAQSGRKVHVVQPKETLYRIGKRYHISVAELYELNPSAREGIQAGQRLILPDRVVVDGTESSKRYHAVQSGETLYGIAKRYGVSVQDIQSANRNMLGASDKIAQGMVLLIPSASAAGAVSSELLPPVPVAPSVDNQKLKVLIVPQGATLYSLLRSTGWTERQFMDYNPQVKDGLKAGAKILVPASYQGGAAAPSVGNEPLVIEPQGRVLTVVLALPFREDSGRRFADYYEGFLLMLKDAQEKGTNVDLHVVDCSDGERAASLQSLRGLPHIDLILGGVSIPEMNDLASVASEKGAVYAIPFTSKKLTATDLGNLKIFQINTPHEQLFEEAADRFVSEYRGYHVHVVRYGDARHSKEAFVDQVRRRLSSGQVTESTEAEMIRPGYMEGIIQQYGRTVVLPDASSLTAANNTLAMLSELVEVVGEDRVTLFGYPEWQTYTRSIGALMRKVNAAFYTTFYADVTDEDYKRFQREVLSWFGHGTGATFPKYSVLGYDTGAFFLLPSAGGLVGDPTGSFRPTRTHRGIQSSFHFKASADNPNLYSNLGVFIVRYTSSGTIERR